MSRKKERPGEEFKNSQDRESHNRSYWFGEVFIDQAWAWVTELIEVEPADGGRCWQALSLCLEQEDDIVPILKGYQPVPEDMQSRWRRVLLEIIAVSDDKGTRGDRNDSQAGRFSLRKRISRSFRGNYRYRA